MLIPNPIRSILFYRRRKIFIDNVAFRVHYIWTTGLLSFSAIFLASKLYLGHPVSCVTQDGKEVTENERQFCFTYAAFSGGNRSEGSDSFDEHVIHHNYYQWVWFVLFLQSVAFYYTHWVWQMLEGGLIPMLVGNLNLPLLPEEKKAKQRKNILLYLRRNRGYLSKYAFQHAMCEAFNLINVMVHLLILNCFVQNSFSSYGLGVLDLIQQKPHLRSDYLTKVFPKTASCEVGEGKESHKIHCVLPINVLNEIVSVFFGFWFFFVLFISIFGIIYRLLTLSPIVKKAILKVRLRLESQREAADFIVDRIGYGEWFLLYKLGINMDALTFGDVLLDVDQAFRKWDEKILEVSNSAPSQSLNHDLDFNA